MNVGIIQKTVAALVVSAAATAGMSGVAFATKNTGKYQQSVEAKKQECDRIWNDFETSVKLAAIADKAGQKDTRDDYLLLAEASFEEGEKAGC